MGWMDTISTRKGLRVDHGVYELELDDTGMVRGTGTVEGEAEAEAAVAVAFALSPGVTPTGVDVGGDGATPHAAGEGVWSVGAHRTLGIRHRVRVQCQLPLAKAGGS